MGQVQIFGEHHILPSALIDMCGPIWVYFIQLFKYSENQSLQS